MYGPGRGAFADEMEDKCGICLDVFVTCPNDLARDPGQKRDALVCGHTFPGVS